MEKIIVPERTGKPSGRPDYSRWTYEELRRFAVQLRVRDAGIKSRRELVELFDGSRRN
ncbi:MAG TPA: hypothetical protein VFO94_11505 [Gammaproteobacteria bacterium]|nr:hypothetical protein [Gammaproteobacteria bacterium]